MAKPTTFREYCQPGVTVSEQRPSPLVKTRPMGLGKPHVVVKLPELVRDYKFHRTIVATSRDSLLVVDQGHHRHIVARRKYRRYLKQKGVL